MASTKNSRRFYIDQEADHAVVRTIPVRRAEPIPQDVVSPATHEVSPVNPDSHNHVHFPRLTPRGVTRIIRPARKRSHRHAS